MQMTEKVSEMQIIEANRYFDIISPFSNVKLDRRDIYKPVKVIRSDFDKSMVAIYRPVELNCLPDFDW